MVGEEERKRRKSSDWAGGVVEVLGESVLRGEWRLGLGKFEHVGGEVGLNREGAFAEYGTVSLWIIYFF